MSNTASIRPAWTPATIGLMVLGFVYFWPLGLAMLAYILWGDRMEDFKTDINRATDKAANAFKFGRSQDNQWGRTGNVAFDDWREEELGRLEEERRKLDAMRHDFDEYQRELRRAKDREEFEIFMKSRDNKSPQVSKTGRKPKAS